MAQAAPIKAGAPTGELGVDTFAALPGWGSFGGQLRGISVDREYVPELRWPRSVTTYERMQNDTQLSGLTRATTLPIRRYVWGIDPNGADPELVAAVCRDFNLPTIADAWAAFQVGEDGKQPRAKSQFRWDRHLTDLLKAVRYGHYYFEIVGEIGDDLLWHPIKIAPRAPWTLGFPEVAENGELIAIKQQVGLNAKELDAARLIPYIHEQDAGDWHGRSLYRACYREWLLKDILLRVDARNHERAGGILLNEAPEGATQEEMAKLASLAQSMTVGGGGSVPHGTTPVFIRGTGSDVIGSIERHDQAMAREFLAMFMSLATTASSGNRALGESFIDWFSLSQEAIAIWGRDTFNDTMISRYCEWNFGDRDYYPRLAFRRPEAANPLDTLASSVTEEPGAAVAVALVGPDGKLLREENGEAYATFGWENGNAIIVSAEERENILEAHRSYEQFARPKRRARIHVIQSSGTATQLPDRPPDRPRRRQPTENEVRSAIDFDQVDKNWQTQTDALVQQWKTIRASQIAELVAKIRAAGGSLDELKTLAATPSGAPIVAAALRTMAKLGAHEAAAEAARQGVDAIVPTLPDETVDARASSIEQILTDAVGQAAKAKAVQLTGGALTADSVATSVKTYLDGLSDSYLSDQLGGALSAAQNVGRLTVMDANNATKFYASELLDTNTCTPCSDVDGTEYDTAEDAAADYPAGGYRECQGGPRCRGTVVAIYDETETPA